MASLPIPITEVGLYDINENTAADLGYTTSGWTCTDVDGNEFGSSTTEDVSITLDTGDDVTCTITNTVIEPQLTVIKTISDSTGDDTTTDAFGPTLLDPSGDEVTVAWEISDSSDSETVTLTENRGL